MRSGSGTDLRPATPADAAAISACAKAAYAPYVSRVGNTPRPMTLDYAEAIRTHQVTVAERDGRIAGFLVLSVTPDGFRLFIVGVDPRDQGTGVGRALLQFAEAEAKRQGHDSIYLSTQEKMTENQALYAKIGYVEYARRVEDGYSRVYMRKRLHHQPPRGEPA